MRFGSGAFFMDEGAHLGSALRALVSGETSRLVSYSCLGPSQNFVLVVKRSPVPPSCDGRALALRGAADAVERSIADGVATVAQELAHLPARQASLRLNWIHRSHPQKKPETGGRLMSMAVKHPEYSGQNQSFLIAFAHHGGDRRARISAPLLWSRVNTPDRYS
jgi:hypothetical protein